jgi:transposase
VHPRTLQRWRTQLATTGSLVPKRPPGRPPKIPVTDHADLVADVLDHADATLDAHCARWKTSHEVAVSRRRCRGCWPPSSSPEKKPLIAREQDAEERRQWRTELTGIAPDRLVFLDETHTTLSMTPWWARARKGDRAMAAVPQRKWHSVSLLATLTPTGPGPAVALTGAVDGDAFRAFIRTALVPTLRRGQIVICDNLQVHKNQRIRRLIEAAGCELRFLPRYSPDFKPIELAFAKLKAHLRREAARTYDDLIDALATGLAAITAQDAASFYAAAGYPLSQGQPLCNPL